MSASTEDIKKFLEEKAKAEDSDTLSVTLVSGTDGSVTQYKVNFIDPQEAEKAEEPAKKAPEPAKKSKKD